MNFKKIAFIAICLLVGFILSTPVWVDRLLVARIHSNWEKEHIAPTSKEFYAHLEAFQSDIDILKPKLSFLDEKATNDAGVFFNPRVKWEFSGQDQVQSKKWATKMALTQKILLPEAAKTMIQESKEKFLDLDSQKFLDVDMKWLSELQGFDHWDIDKNSPLDLYPRYSFETPFPTFDVHSPKIHLIKASRGTDIEFTEAILMDVG